MIKLIKMINGTAKTGMSTKM